MKAKRRVDDLGRVAITRELRTVCGWEPGDWIVMDTDGENVWLRKVEEGEEE